MVISIIQVCSISSAPLLWVVDLSFYVYISLDFFLPNSIFICIYTEKALELLFGYLATAGDDEAAVQIHCMALLGGCYTCLSITLICLGIFQPSSNARKFALVSFAIMQGMAIRAQFRLPSTMDKKGGGGNETQAEEEESEEGVSMKEIAVPLLHTVLLSIALVGATLSRTDAHRARIVRNRKKAELYLKQAKKVAFKKQE